MATYKVKPSNWAAPATTCCPTFGAAVTTETNIWWDSTKPSYVLSAILPIAFCPFCGSNVTAVPE